MTRHFDAIVVGCGAMGSSAGSNLASRGVSTLVLERFGLNHDRGSSHGRTRIFRQAYYEDERYVPMLKRALESWRELEARSGRALLTMTGGLMIGRPDGELVAGARRSAELHGIGHRMMTAREVNEEYRAFRLDDGLSALYEENAGALSIEECLEAFVGLGRRAGGEFRFEEEMTKWKTSQDGVEVATPKGDYTADRLVLCGGPWMTKLVGGLPLECERQVQFWFPSEGRDYLRAGGMPVFISEEEGGAFYYGIPDVGDGVKVARSHGGRPADPDHADRTVNKDDVGQVESFIQRRMTKLGPPVASATCLYTNTPDHNFVVGPHPDSARVTVVSACSGHGFKFASVMGEVVADLVTKGKSTYDISFLSPGRFAAGGRA